MNLQNFVRNGGVFIGSDDTADFAVSTGFTPGVSIQRSQRLRAIGDVLRTKTIDSSSPIAYGYGDSLSVYCFNGPIFNVSNVAGGGGGGRRGPRSNERATGRGTVDDPDVVQGRPPAEVPEPPPSAETWEAAPIMEEQRRNLVGLIPSNQRPRVVLRWGDARDLLRFRFALEPACVMDAIESASDDTLKSLNEFRRFSGNHEDFIAYNRAFHSALAHASGNRRITCSVLLCDFA